MSNIAIQDLTIPSLGNTYTFTQVDNTLTVTGAAADAKKTGDEISSVKQDLTTLVQTPEETEADLYLSDEDGNVIAQFADGDIQTKNFDSADASEVKAATDNDADFYVADASGNGILRLHSGQVQTLKFNTDDSGFSASFAYDSTSGSKTITHNFPKGTKLALALLDPTNLHTGSVVSYNITYSYTDTSGVSHTIGQAYGYDFLEYTLTETASSVTATYPAGLFGGLSGTLAFVVYVIPTYGRKPTIIKVDANGNGDYTTLKAAVASITDNNDYNKYEIWLYPGTYNVLSDYTQAEIEADGFVGLWLNNGVSLIGIGQRDEIIIHGELDTTTYNSTIRNAVSTLNVAGDVTIKNVTITAKNIRYAVHDDTGSPTHKVNVRRYINCKMYGESLTSGGSMERSYGAGGGNRKTVYAKDCDFSDCFALHNQQNMTHPYEIYLDNCTARRFTFTHYPSTIGTYVHMHNCKASLIRIDQTDTSSSQALFITGEGACGAMIDVPSGYYYETGDTAKFEGASISAGNAVKVTGIGNSAIAVCTDISQIYGIAIGADANGDAIVQTGGYINSNTLGLSGLSVGDYLTIDGNGAVVSGGTSSNSIAVVKMVGTDGTAFAKLLI